MGLETGTEIPDLNTAWPLGSDDIELGDDHLRLIKTCILGSFPGMTAPWSAPGEDINFRDAGFRTITVTDQIISNPQVAIALFGFDGADGSINGNGYGVVSGTRTGTGAYSFTLVDNVGAASQMVGSGSANVGIVAVAISAFRDPSDANIVNCNTNLFTDGAAIDCQGGFLTIFDAQRL